MDDILFLPTYGILFLPTLHLINQDIYLVYEVNCLLKKFRKMFFFGLAHFFTAGDAAVWRAANNESSKVIDSLLPVTFYFNSSTRLDNVKNL